MTGDKRRLQAVARDDVRDLLVLERLRPGAEALGRLYVLLATAASTSREDVAALTKAAGEMRLVWQAMQTGEVTADDGGDANSMLDRLVAEIRDAEAH